MEITLYSFSEALEKLKKKEISALIRAKDMEADFINRCILLYETKKFVKLKPNWSSGKPDALYLSELKEKDNCLTTSLAYIKSDDILACDYIDTNEWTLFDSKKKYEEAMLDKLKNVGV